MRSKATLTRRRLIQGATATAILAGCGEATDRADPTATTAPAPQEATSTTAPPPATAEATAPPAPTATSAPPTSTTTLPPTLACDDDDDDPTLAQAEGPFYTPQTPERTSFLGDGPGTKIVVTGRVITTDCQPIAGAIVDFWHANDAGAYDNAGYAFRGHQFTDANGNYRLETIVPGLYPGRTRHFHVKVQGPQTALLTTQLYFPDEPSNARDGIFHPSLVMAMQPAAEGQRATFDFVLA